eukprot:snap_masked-scaffold_3-processed-gene-21.80-mRNA-1 protein AED:1.00 eAED:1.00 QI:0/-1/0/0/-1/1/1/0/367
MNIGKLLETNMLNIIKTQNAYWHFDKSLVYITLQTSFKYFGSFNLGSDKRNQSEKITRCVFFISGFNLNEQEINKIKIEIERFHTLKEVHFKEAQNANHVVSLLRSIFKTNPELETLHFSDEILKSLDEKNLDDLFQLLQRNLKGKKLKIELRSNNEYKALIPFNLNLCKRNFLESLFQIRSVDLPNSFFPCVARRSLSASISKTLHEIHLANDFCEKHFVLSLFGLSSLKKTCVLNQLSTGWMDMTSSSSQAVLYALCKSIFDLNSVKRAEIKWRTTFEQTNSCMNYFNSIFVKWIKEDNERTLSSFVGFRFVGAKLTSKEKELQNSQIETQRELFKKKGKRLSLVQPGWRHAIYNTYGEIRKDIY